MRTLRLCFLLFLHICFWGVFLRHVPFGFAPLHFLDFDNYLHLWRDVLAGNNPYTVSHMITLGPPTVLIPYLPFLFFPEWVAQLLFFMLNVISGYALCWVLVRSYMKRNVIAFLSLSLILFITFPVRFSLLMGQPGLFLALCVTLVLCVQRLQKISLWILILSKTFFIFFLISWLKDKKKKITHLCMGLLLTIAVFSPLLPFQWYSYYVTHTLSQTTVGALSDTTTDYYNQSLKSTLHRIRADSLLLAVQATLSLAVAWLVYRRGDRFAGITAGILLSPVVWQHYMVYLFPVFVIAFLHEKGRRRWILFLAFLSANVAFPALHEVTKTPITAVLASHMFLGGVLLLIILLSRDIKRYN